VSVRAGLVLPGGQSRWLPWPCRCGDGSVFGRFHVRLIS
jgi:hypothetical protein